MKKLLIAIVAMTGAVFQSHAIDNNTVEIVYSGTTASVTVADNISSYVTVSSGTSSQVVITQISSFAGVDATDTNTSGEITYILSGSSSAGSFKLTGSYKCSISLAGLALTNSSGPALNILNGKRIKLSAKRDTENTLTATSNSTYNGCIYTKGHLEIQGNGTLNINDSYAHGIKAKEYVQVKNLTLNITSTAKDGINCGEYFWMKSGTVTLSGIGSDGIEVSLKGTTSTGEITATDTTDAHEDEDSGNFYQDGGTLTISLASDNTTGTLIQVAGTKTHSGGTYNGTSYTGIEIMNREATTNNRYYDLQGHSVKCPTRGLYLINNNGKNKKVIIK